jgi:hypothetical protein
MATPRNGKEAFGAPDKKQAARVVDWEQQVIGQWAEAARNFPHYEADKYKEAYRMSKPAFQGLCNTYLKGTMCEREDTNMRACEHASLSKKGLLCFLIGLAQACRFKLWQG